jgi:hypothetical protein
VDAGRAFLREANIARLGLVALALVEWRHAATLVWGGFLPLHPFAIGLVAALYLSSFALLLLATARKDPTPRGIVWLGPMVLVIVAFAYQDAIRKLQSDIYPTTDAHAFMDVAARLLVHGKNPYTESLVDAFRIYQLPLRYATPLLNGDFSDRVAYPSVSFLVLVPFVLLHVPTYIAYAAAFVGAIAVLVRYAPWWARGLVFALFTHDDTFLLMTFGGVTDSVWALCLVFAVVLWHRPTLAGVLVGVACAQKQHAWFFVPYLLIRLCREESTPPWRGAPLAFLKAAAGIFLITNLPFAIWNPAAWLQGIVEPLVAPMIQLSEGLTMVGMTGYIPLSRSATTLLFWTLFAYSLFVYWRHAASIRSWCWFLPAVVLWFGYRALMSYWYFNALLVAAAVVTSEPERSMAVAGPSRKLTVGLGLAWVAALGAVLTVFAFRGPAFDVKVMGPLETWESHVFRIRVRVTSHLDFASRMRFSVQSTAVQPIQWIVDFDDTVGPRGTADFIIRSPRPNNTFEISAGARISAFDRENASLRGHVSVPAEISVMRFDHVANGRFDYFDIHTMTPFGWSFDPSDSAVHFEPSIEPDDAARVALAFDEERPSEPVISPMCAPSQKLRAPSLPHSRFGDLYTTLEVPLEPITMTVRVPSSANRAPYDELYGLHLARPGFEGFVLFGADTDHGVLPSGSHFVNVPAPRDTWTQLTLLLPDLLRRLDAPSAERRHQYVRFLDMDVPSRPVQLGWFASLPSGRTGNVAFGAMTQPLGERGAELVLRRSGPSSGRIEWRAARELENGNFDHASALLQGIVATTPTLERLALLGEVELRAKRYSEARQAYSRALAIASTPEVEKGLGWSLLHSGDAAAAIPHLEIARDRYAEIESGRPRTKYFDAVCALVIARAKVGDCTGSRAAAEQARAEDRRTPPPEPQECPR